MNILTLAETLQEGRTARQVDTGREVIKIKKGSLVWKECRNTVQLTGKTLHSEFEIVPNYVSFGEAMDAYQEGKKVTLHLGYGGNFHFSKDGYGHNAEFPFIELVEGKWTIEEDSQ